MACSYKNINCWEIYKNTPKKKINNNRKTHLYTNRNTSHSTTIRINYKL
ncbi:unnamed protein product [Meloidogyne enterolobii]|uniref:Uncharacterized protein n=1 Tax=Meloidogyne enterolobii TaxID=390850 RepID=A0ACB1AM34_MELEN